MAAIPPFRSALRGSQNSRSLASGSWREEDDCAVASTSAAHRLHCCHVDARSRKFRGDGTGTVVPVNVQRRTFAQPELSLLCGGHKSGGVFGDEFELRSPRSVLVTPECDEVHARITQRSQNAGSFADLVENRRLVVLHHANFFGHDALVQANFFCHDSSSCRCCTHCK
jgi:hypothetical protein